MSARHGCTDLARTRSGARYRRQRARAAFSSPSPAERCASRKQPQHVPTAHALWRRGAEVGRERRARSLVTPFDGALVTCDQAHSMEATEIAVHKRVSGLGLVRRAVREPRCHSAYSSQESEAKNAFCCAARGCTLPQLLSRTYWRASISRRARATARSEGRVGEAELRGGVRDAQPRQPVAVALGRGTAPPAARTAIASSCIFQDGVGLLAGGPLYHQPETPLEITG
jgi:hypothetical protein